jgi:hypothetical protein
MSLVDQMAKADQLDGNFENFLHGFKIWAFIGHVSFQHPHDEA